MSSIVIAGDTSGSVTLQAPAVSGSSVLSLPAVTDTVAGIAATQTLTNKTLTAPTIASANLTTALTLTGASGTNGQVLTSGGSGVAPTWTTISGSSQWTTSGSNIYYSTGKVGIGTSTIASQLDVRNGATNATGINTNANQISITHNSNNGVGGQAEPAGFVVIRDKASAVSSGDFLGGLSWNARYTDTEDRAGYASILAVATGSGTADLTFNTSSSNITTAERLRLNGNGALILSGGTATADGVGITFPASQSASTNANTLDDYEEGTWTPVYTPSSGAFSTITYWAQYGFYQKIGNTVHIQMYFYLTNFSVGTATGQLFITGLPFTAVGSSQNQSGTVGYTYAWDTNSPTKAAVYQGTTRIEIYRDAQGSVNSSPELTAANLKNGNPANVLSLAISYRVA